MSKKDGPANTLELGKPQRDEKGRWMKGTPPPNPTGRPADGESWAAIIKEIGEMPAEEIIALVGRDNDLGRAFASMPRKVAVKKLVIVRIFAALMFDPSSGLLKELLDRVDGKVKEKIEHSGNITWAEFVANARKSADK